ncbi:AsnC family transcriptional regulator [Candidatus Woesearchaeota archaeon]|nr:AsnC family transcriptional regulator [Candidatus Woesearchaeota archaeon]
MEMPKGRIAESARLSEIKLDLKDKKILSMLSDNSRVPLNSIAKKVRLSRDAIDYRIKRLVKEGVIMLFFPIINLEKFGYTTYHIFFLVDEMDRKQQDEFLLFLKSNPYVKNIIEYSDRWDYEVVIVSKNVREFDDIVEQITSKFPQLIFEKEKMEVIKGYNSIHLPLKFYEQSGHKYEEPDIVEKEVKLDEIDFKILELLCENCRMPSVKIAEKVDLTADAINYRIKKMIDGNIIRRFTILVNLSALNFHWYTFSMAMKTFNNQYDAKLRQFVVTHPYILRAVKTLGVWDFLFYIVADNPRHFHYTVKEIKNYFSEIIRNHQTLLAYVEHLYVPMPKAVKFKK